MTARTQSANLLPLVSRNAIGEKIARGLRLFVGRGRRMSVKQLQNAAGVDARVIECAMCQPDDPEWRMMPADKLLSVASVLGADFTNEWLPLAAQGAFDLPDDDDDPQPGDLAADAAEHAATVARAARGGAFEPGDMPALRLVGAAKMRSGAILIGMAGGVAPGRRAVA